MDINETLKNRNNTHGAFDENARLTQNLMLEIEECAGYKALTLSQRHSLYMIIHKISRIVCGNADYPEHWHDIVGYAHLIEERLEDKAKIPSVTEQMVNGAGELPLENKFHREIAALKNYQQTISNYHPHLGNRDMFLLSIVGFIEILEIWAQKGGDFKPERNWFAVPGIHPQIRYYCRCEEEARMFYTSGEYRKKWD